MRVVAHAIVWLILLTGFSGCIADDDAGSDRQYIDDELDLIDYIEEGICGDIDGDGIPDCPLSGYIEGPSPLNELMRIKKLHKAAIVLLEAQRR